MDNASNNNTFVERFYDHLGMDWKHYWLYYGCHILNLAAKHGLYGVKKERGTPVNAALKAYWHEQENKAALALKAQIHTEHVDEKAIEKQREVWR